MSGRTRAWIERLQATHSPHLPELWTLMLPRVVVLAMGLVVAVVAVPMTPARVAVAAGAVLWVAVTTSGAIRAQRRGTDPRRWVAGCTSPVDAALRLLAVAASGGADSPLRWLLVAGPAIWVNARHPRVVLLGALGALGYLAVSVDDLLAARPYADTTVIGFLAVYAGAVVTARATLISFRREARLHRQIEQERAEAEVLRLSEARRQHEQLVQRLHDGPLQLTLAAAQDLQELDEGGTVAVAETLETLRLATAEMQTLSGELYASVLRDADLATALERVARTLGDRGASPTRVTVGVDAGGRHDELLVSIAKELLTNVHKHARASRSDVVVTASDARRTISMTVTDDGRGFSDQDRSRAAHDGHIGLASIAHRVRAEDGEIDIERTARGTAVTVRLPGDGDGGDPAVR